MGVMTFDDPHSVYYHPKVEMRPASMQAIDGLKNFYRITFPMPFLLDHVYCYAVEEADGWVLIDTGLGGVYGEFLWSKYSNNFFGSKGVKRLIVTHFHPDHAGASGWLSRRYGCEVYMPCVEYQQAQIFLNLLMHSCFVEGSVYHLRCGVEVSELGKLCRHYSYLASFYSGFPSSYRRLGDGDVLDFGGESWKVSLLEGHSPSQAILWNRARNFALVADQAIYKISPNVGLMPFEMYLDRFGSWSMSLDAMRGLEGVYMLSGHRKIFAYSAEYHRWILSDHEDKFSRILEVCETRQYLPIILESMFRRKLTDNDMFFAYGEGLAHVNYLLARSELIEVKDDMGFSQFVVC